MFNGGCQKQKKWISSASFLVTPPRHDEPQGQEGDLKKNQTNRLVHLKEKTY